MPNYRGLVPRIVWGSTQQHFALARWPFDDAVAYLDPDDSSEFVHLPSAVMDSYIPAELGLLRARWRRIPPNNVATLDPRPGTGWNGAAGIEQMLSWARKSGLLYLFPDSRNLLLTPLLTATTNWSVLNSGPPALPLPISTAGSRSVSGAGTALSLDATVPAGGFYIAYQLVPVGPFATTPGSPLTLSVDISITAKTGSARAYAQMNTVDEPVAVGYQTANSAFISTVGGFTRVSATIVNAHASTFYIAVYLYVFAVNAGETITAVFKNAQLEARSSASTFVDASTKYLVYLKEPLHGAPPLENDLSRSLDLVLMNSVVNQSIDGY